MTKYNLQDSTLGAHLFFLICRGIQAQIYRALRLVQNITGCSTRTLNVFLDHMHHIFFKGCAHVKKWEMPRVRARTLSPLKRCLHGCVGCDNYVYGPDSEENECPKCGDARFSDGKTKEVALFFFFCFLFFFCIYIHKYLNIAGVLVLSDERTIEQAHANR